MSRALITSRACGDNPDGRGVGVNLIVAVIVISYRETSPVSAEVRGVLVLPNAGLQFSEIRREPPGLLVMSAEGFHQAVGGKARGLAALVDGFRQCVGNVNDDERDERNPERHE